MISKTALIMKYLYKIDVEVGIRHRWKRYLDNGLPEEELNLFGQDFFSFYFSIVVLGTKPRSHDGRAQASFGSKLPAEAGFSVAPCYHSGFLLLLRSTMNLWKLELLKNCSKSPGATEVSPKPKHPGYTPGSVVSSSISCR